LQAVARPRALEQHQVNNWDRARLSVVVPIGVIVAVAIVCIVVAVLSSARRADEVDAATLRRTLERLNQRGREKMQRDGAPSGGVEVREYADMRYVGQSYELTVELAGAGDAALEKAVAAFHRLHQALYGHSDERRIVEFVNLRTVHVHRLPSKPAPGQRAARHAAAASSRRAYFPSIGKYVDTSVYSRGDLAPGSVIRGPSIVEQADTTLVIYPEQVAQVQAEGSILVEAKSES